MAANGASENTVLYQLTKPLKLQKVLVQKVCMIFSVIYCANVLYGTVFLACINKGYSQVLIHCRFVIQNSLFWLNTNIIHVSVYMHVVFIIPATALMSSVSDLCTTIYITLQNSCFKATLTIYLKIWSLIC